MTPINKKDRVNFLFSKDWFDFIKTLPDEIAGRFIKGICLYSFEDIIDPLDFLVSSHKPKMDRDWEQYQDYFNQKSEAGKKSAQLRKVNGVQRRSTKSTYVNPNLNLNLNLNPNLNQNLNISKSHSGTKVPVRSDSQLLVDYFCNSYKDAYKGEIYAPAWSKDCAAMKKILSSGATIDLIKSKITMFFAMDMPWVTGRRDIGLFINQYNKIGEKENKNKYEPTNEKELPEYERAFNKNRNKNL